eukprot:tig00000254_g22446.t1
MRVPVALVTTPSQSAQGPPRPAAGAPGGPAPLVVHRPVTHFKLASAAAALVSSALGASVPASPSLAPAAGASPCPPLGLDPAAPRLSVLVAEDNPVNQRVAKKLLSILGCDADIAADGVEAVAKCEAREYDVVLMDLMMPRMSGLEACGRILSSGAVRRKPAVVALTANVEREVIEQCKAAGMRLCIAKPFQKSDLVSVLSLVASGRL